MFGLEKITNLNVRNYLESNLFPDLRTALQKVSPDDSQLVDEIHANGQLEKYWQEAEKKNEVARRAARRLEKERRKLELGSDYESSQDEFSAFEPEEEYEEEESEEDSDEDLTEEQREEK